MDGTWLQQKEVIASTNIQKNPAESPLPDILLMIWLPVQ
jgi:hypothetical protein